MNHILGRPREFPFQHVQSQVSKALQVVFPAFKRVLDSGIGNELVQFLGLLIAPQINHFPLNVHELLHLFEVNQDDVLVIVEHHMVRVDVPVEVPAVMEELKGLDDLLRYLEWVHLYALQPAFVLFNNQHV